MVIDVKSYVQQKKEWLKENKTGKLLILQTGDDKGSNAYVNGKLSDCADVCFESHLEKFPEGVSPDKIVQYIQENKDNYTGIILQMPYYGSGDPQVIIDAIPIEKDVDGFKVGSPFIPCTPLGIYNLMRYLNCIPEQGKVVVVGRGKLVGKPLAKLLIERTNLTVVICNSHTKQETLKEECLSADIIITAVGKHNVIKDSMVKDGAYVFDAGIDFVDGKICGDCSGLLYKRQGVFVTKTPGGVGLTTRLELLNNTSVNK